MSAITAAILFLSCSGPATGEPPDPEDVSPQPPAAGVRIVAVGDLHGDMAATREVLSMAGLVDGDRWVGGSAVLVQTGDVMDRGDHGGEILRFLQGLGQKARAAGGDVIELLGNHEAMNLQGDLRSVSPGDVASFGGPVARRAAFSPDGELGAMLLERPPAVLVGETVFVHGGLSSAMASFGLDGLADRVQDALRGARDPILGPDGPLWYRGYWKQDEAVACREAEAVLEKLGARRVVTGHTIQPEGRIGVRCDGAILGIDVGMAEYAGSHRAALELRGGTDAWAIYPDGPEDLPDPSAGVPAPERP